MSKRDDQSRDILSGSWLGIQQYWYIDTARADWLEPGTLLHHEPTNIDRGTLRRV
jgi:hypothetical protein